MVWAVCTHPKQALAQKAFRHPPSQTRDKRSQGVRRTHPGPRHVAAFAPHIPRLHLEWDSPPPGTSVTRRPASAPWSLKWKSARYGYPRFQNAPRNANAHSCGYTTCDLRDCVCRVRNPLFFRQCSFALQGLFLCPSPGAKWVPLCLLRKKTSLGLLLVACWRRVCVDRGATGVNGFADTSVRTGPGPKLQRVFFRGMRLMKKKHVSGGREGLLISVEMEIDRL
jgi:hypothetical protein